MTKDEATDNAREFLKYGQSFSKDGKHIPRSEVYEQPVVKDSLTAQEPVAWMNDIAFSMEKDELTADKFGDIVPLYTHPKQWQGLSYDEIRTVISANHNWMVFARAIEAKLKEKNTDR